MIRAVLFDYGNVIARFDHMVFFERIARRSSLPREEVKEVVLRQREVLFEYERGHISSAEFYRCVAKACTLSMSLEEFKAAFVDIFTIIPETLALIRRLTPRYRLGILSNTNEWHYESHIRTLEEFPLFDVVALSFRVGAMKPDERFYRHALAQLSLPAAACVYVDDVEEYVNAAARLGFIALQYTSHAELLASLDRLGVLPTALPESRA
ncbi:MAG: hypothetical protein C4326_07615 [Ignavibacteria bacterium]